MAKRRYSAEQIVSKWREAEVHLAKGLTTGEVCKQLGITENTYYRWRKEYGGLRVDQAKRLKELEKENTRLKKLVAEQALDIRILKEASRGNWRARLGGGGLWSVSVGSWASRNVVLVGPWVSRARRIATSRECVMTRLT